MSFFIFSMFKFIDFFSIIILPTKKFIVFVSSPIGIRVGPEAITFSISVEPHLGTPTIKIGFIFSILNNSLASGSVFNQYSISFIDESPPVVLE